MIDVDELQILTEAGRPILDGVSLQVPPGGVCALVGESGSGKTTLALTLLGRIRPGLRRTAGSVQVARKDPFALGRAGLRAFRRDEIAWVGQDPALSLTPWHTIRTILTEAAGRRSDDAELVELLTRAGIGEPGELLDRRPGQLSGGQRRRAALARAMSRCPQVLILDEPTSGLDAAAVDEVLATLEGLRLDTTTVILITHDMSVAARCADQITVLEAGRVAESGPAARVLGAPASAAARALVAADPGRRRTAARPSCITVEDATGSAAQPEAPRDETLLSLAGLQVGIPGGPVLADGIDLELAAGAATAIVGPSGTGKTTLVNAVVGLNPARRGRIWLRGEILAPRYQDRTREQLLAVQLVPQDPARMLNPALTVRRQLSRALRRFRPGLSRAAMREALEEVLVSVRLDPAVLDQRPPSLSGGQSQRVAIARALAHRPAVLICDESTSALDPTVQREVLDTLAGLRRSGLAMLVVTHDRGVAGFLCDSVLELR